jgi:hypothetical protein
MKDESTPNFLVWSLALVFYLFALTNTAHAQLIENEKNENLLKKAVEELYKTAFKLERAKAAAIKGNYKKALALIDDAEKNFDKMLKMVDEFDANEGMKKEARDNIIQLKIMHIDSFRNAIKDMMRE